jgi:hypothetical protein
MMSHRSAELPFSQILDKIPQGRLFMQAQLKQEEVALSQYAVIEVVNPEVLHPLINQQAINHQEPIKKMDDIELDQFIRGISALCDCV